VATKDDDAEPPRGIMGGRFVVVVVVIVLVAAVFTLEAVSELSGDNAVGDGGEEARGVVPTAWVVSEFGAVGGSSALVNLFLLLVCFSMRLVGYDVVVGRFRSAVVVVVAASFASSDPGSRGAPLVRG